MVSKNPSASPLTSRTLVDIDPIFSNGTNNDQHSTSDLSKIFRGIFHRSTKSRYPREREMATISATLIKPSDTMETTISATNNAHMNDLCLFSDSPHYIVRVWYREDAGESCG